VVAVGDIVPADNLAYLLKYDSIQGRFTGTVGSEKSAADKPDDDVLIVNGQKMLVVSAKDPSSCLETVGRGRGDRIHRLIHGCRKGQRPPGRRR